MQFSTFAAAFALAAGANAAVIQRDGARLAQFRVFNVEGCDEFNQGFYTVDESDVDVCKSFSAIEDPGVGSVNLEQLNNSDCSLHIFTDEDCSSESTEVSEGVCSNAPSEGTSFKSWRLSCGGY